MRHDTNAATGMFNGVLLSTMIWAAIFALALAYCAPASAGNGGAPPPPPPPSATLELYGAVQYPKGVEGSFARMVNAYGGTEWSLDPDGTITFHNAATIDFAGFWQPVPGRTFAGPVIGYIKVYVGGSQVLIEARPIVIVD